MCNSGALPYLFIEEKATKWKLIFDSIRFVYWTTGAFALVMCGGCGR